MSKLGVAVSLVCVALGLASVSPRALAQQPSTPPRVQDPTDRALTGLSPAELQVLAPLLRTGTVALVEFAYEGQLPGVIFATLVNASPDELAAVVGDPRRYPDFMPALDEVEVDESTAEATAGAQLSYAWTWRTAVFALHGTNTMQRFAPPAGHPEVGYRFVVRATTGDLGASRTVWRILPWASGGSLLMTSSRLDLRDSNYIARQVSRAGTTISRSVNIAMTSAMLLRSRMEAERRAGHTRGVLTVSDEPERPAFDPIALESLLRRGDVIWVETSGDDLGRVAVIGAMHTPEPTTRAAMLDPQGFARGLISGAHVTELERGEDGVRFEWGIDLPLVGTSGQMRLGERAEGRIHLDGIQGALGTARWRFETHARPYGTLVVTWGHFDPADGIWFMRAVADADGAFRPGLASAAQLMMMRGLRSRLVRGL